MPCAKDGQGEPKAKKTVRELNRETLLMLRTSTPDHSALVDTRMRCDGVTETRPASSE
ncbi:MAG: hypothetical protein WAV25_02605 [Minisyncoccia bacterium]